MKLKKYINVRGKQGVRLTRLNVFVRDSFQCQYCHDIFTKKHLTLDHVHPISKGGEHSWENIVTACNICNNKKGSKSLQEFGHYPLNKPVEPQWLPNTELNLKASKIPEEWRQYLCLDSFDW